MNVHPAARAASSDTGSIGASDAVPIAIAHGDGIGPEIMSAALKVLTAAGARLAPEEIEIGEAVYEQGLTSGIAPESWDVLRRTKVFFKAPITTPQGKGYKSLNVTIRKTLGLFANVRPCAALSPFVATKHPDMDVVIVRENEEDLYAGIEHRQTDEVYQCLKLVSRPGTERIVRYAFDYARANGRKKVSCFSKDNIMKLTDGLFHKVFDEIAAEYPEIETDHWIIDIGTARLAARPEIFDVIVTSNLYGDIISDVAAEISGSVGLGASANVGEHCAMFEAIHGSAPDIAGQNVANPSGLLLAGVQMLVHVGQPEIASKIHNAWLKTIEDGIHTADIHKAGDSAEKVGTDAFAEAVIARLGESPRTLPAVSYALDARPVEIAPPRRPAPQVKTLVGVDVFVHWREADADALAAALKSANAVEGLDLILITNRGTKVWPEGLPETFATDHWRCRFMFDGTGQSAQVAALLTQLAKAGIDFVKTEHLYEFDGQLGYSLGQGQ
ncbi:NADP-dependent isocitrate dehydrogenase [Stappia sp.]|uniref:NADP-dependent isocitrate dehydrogenase n=1 Tax=Stappia sp. TaxID=1870903 RepID=UPI0032D9463F